MAKLNEKDLKSVSGGSEDAKYVNVKVAITYLYQNQEHTDGDVTLKVEAKNNQCNAEDIKNAAIAWCNEKTYEYKTHIVLNSDSFFVFY